jgi:conjugative transfer signal peptidase TraF
MPIGFYRRVRAVVVKRGDLVAVCLPKPIAVVALQRGYLRTGHCPGEVVPVLKQVIAIPGDRVILTNHAIKINSVNYTAAFMPTDHNKKPIKKWIVNGCYLSSGYWIYGANDTANSWDSRYYGPVNRSAILGVYKPLLIFKNKGFVKPYPSSTIH